MIPLGGDTGTGDGQAFTVVMPLMAEGLQKNLIKFALITGKKA